MLGINISIWRPSVLGTGGGSTLFTLGQAYALSTTGTAFGETLPETDAPRLFAAPIRPLGYAGLFD